MNVPQVTLEPNMVRFSDHYSDLDFESTPERLYVSAWIGDDSLEHPATLAMDLTDAQAHDLVALLQWHLERNNRP